jgi:hypothetical protein
VESTADALLKVEGNTVLVNDLKKQFTKIATKKVEESEFQRALSEVSRRMDIMQKRITLSETDN